MLRRVADYCGDKCVVLKSDCLLPNVNIPIVSRVTRAGFLHLYSWDTNATCPEGCVESESKYLWVTYIEYRAQSWKQRMLASVILGGLIGVGFRKSLTRNLG